MRTILIFLLIFISTEAKSQVTFEKTYPFSSANAIEELSDQTFVGCGDSSQTGFIFWLDRYGNISSSFTPIIRNNSVSVLDITVDPVTNGYAICGHANDTSGLNFTGYYLLLDSQLTSTDSLFFDGGNNGPTANIILRTPTNDFVVGEEAFHGTGTYTTAAHKINYPSINSWSANVMSSHSNNGMAIDSSGKLMIANFYWVAASQSNLYLYDILGNPLHTFTISDTAYGGSLVFQSMTSPSSDGNYMFGVNLSPSSLTYGLPYISKLDTTLSNIWEKYLNWGFHVRLVAFTPTNDSCIVMLLNTENGLAIHKINSSGDSLWTQFHNRPTSGTGNRFQQCADHGFVIVGTFNDSLSSYGYILKTDSLGRLLPPVNITIDSSSTICPGDSVELSAPPGFSYLWSTSDTTQSIITALAQEYWVTVTDSNLISAISDTLSISNYQVDTVVITLSNDSLMTSASGNFQWYLNSNPIGADSSHIKVIGDGVYEVHVTDANGCIAFSAPYIVTSMDELANQTLVMETDNNISILFPENISVVRVFDLTGKLLFINYPENNYIQINKKAHSFSMLVVVAETTSKKMWRRLFSR